MSSRNTIILATPELDEVYEEGRAGGTIKPGMQIIIGADGLLVAGPAAGVVAEAAIAIEDDLQNHSINDSYVATDLVRYFIPQPGTRMQLILKAGQTVTDGDYLTPNGDGTFKKWTNEASKQFKCMEDMDLSAGGAVDTFIRARRV